MTTQPVAVEGAVTQLSAEDRSLSRSRLLYFDNLRILLIYSLRVHEGFQGSFWRFLPPYLENVNTFCVWR